MFPKNSYLFTTTQQNLFGFSANFTESIRSLPFLNRKDVQHYAKEVPAAQKIKFITKHFLDWLFFPQQLAFYDQENQGIIFRGAVKRGNKAYSKRVYGKLCSFARHGSFEKYLESFNYEIGRVGGFLVTLTYPESMKYTAWKRRIAHDFNLYTAKLRQRYGKIQFIRCWESTFRGAPHIHAMILFAGERKPLGFAGKDGLVLFDRSEFDFVKGAWPHVSHIDPIRDTIKSFFHIFKYVLKALDFTDRSLLDAVISKYTAAEYMTKQEKTIMKSILTNSLSWFNNRRSYSVSHELMEQIRNDSSILIQYSTNSNMIFLGIVPHTGIKGGFYSIHDEKIKEFLSYHYPDILKTSQVQETPKNNLQRFSLSADMLDIEMIKYKDVNT